ncbi:MAG: LysR family transcriptional regulator [Bradyrhizobiaceae bacterium]|nr:MAG: LysR family transcriptional regulator [Bradyrhizobiaceae bacterium]
MDLKQLQYFLCLVQEGNVTRAARQLNIVQPALSMQIAKLEAHFGKKLFYRSAYGVSLTAAGEKLAELAAGLAQNAANVQEEMDRLDGSISGRVTIGMITSAAQSTLAPSSAKIAALYPGIQLSVCEGYTDTLVEWVNTGQLDIAIINMPPTKPALPIHHIVEEGMMLAQSVAVKSLPENFSFRALRDMDIVIPSRRHGLRRILDAMAAKVEISLKPRLEIDTLSAICEIVASTDLVTVLPGIALHPSLTARRVRAQRIKRPAVTRSVAWVTHPKRTVTAAMAAVMKVLSEDLVSAAKSVKIAGTA